MYDEETVLYCYISLLKLLSDSQKWRDAHAQSNQRENQRSAPQLFFEALILS